MTELFDPGLQPERTALSWRRTGLALGVGALASFRILPLLIGPWGFLPASLGLAASIAILIAGERRYRSDHRALTGAGVLAGGALPALVALLVLLAGIGALVLVLSRVA